MIVMKCFFASMPIESIAYRYMRECMLPSKSAFDQDYTE